jgi:hypothetical protein
VSEVRVVRVRLGDGSIKECSVEYSQTPPWSLKFFGLELKRRKFEGDDLFETLTALRRELEAVDAQLLCAGARPEVFPSGMSRGMGGGRRAYVTRLGQPALRTDLVDIFDDAEPDAVGTVEEQKAFHARWVEGLRQR